MKILSTKGWSDYELLDSGEGYRLERFGKYRLVRPDPQAIWQRQLAEHEWERADALFEKKDEKDRWVNKQSVPEKWLMQYKAIKFWAELSPFKHTGIFPEQHLMWDFLSSVIARSETTKQSYKKEIATLPLVARNDNRAQLNVLNLFAYTGIASLVCAAAGSSVTHVDASKPTIGWARENQAVSDLQNKPIRWILDDAIKFTEREVKRGVRYDGIIMDPPVYGHGPHGERWDFSESFPKLLEVCRQVLSDKPVFILINAYAISASSLMLENVLTDMMNGKGGTVEAGELALQHASSDRLLSTGIFARWSK